MWLSMIRKRNRPGWGRHRWSCVEEQSSYVLENHDTGYRTNEDDTPQEGHRSDQFLNGWEVEQAYAYILTHPGIPCVYWKHYFDWGPDLQNKIAALINARKVAGVNAGSNVFHQNNAKDRGVYAAMVGASMVNCT